MLNPDDFEHVEDYEDYLDNQRDYWEYSYENWRDDEYSRLAEEIDEFIQSQLHKSNNFFDSEAKLLPAILSHVQFNLTKLESQSGGKND